MTETFPNGYISLWKKRSTIEAARVEGISPQGLPFSRIYFQGLTTTPAGRTDQIERSCTFSAVCAGCRADRRVDIPSSHSPDHVLGHGEDAATI